MKVIEVSSIEPRRSYLRTCIICLIFINSLASVYLFAGMYYLDGSFYPLLIILAESFLFYVLYKFRLFRVFVIGSVFRLACALFLCFVVAEAITVTSNFREHQQRQLQKLSMMKAEDNN